MKSFDCAIFDLDGTLLDSTDVWHRVDVEFFRQRGLALPRDYAAHISPMGFRRAAEYTIERFSLNETVDEVMSVWNEMAQKLFETDVPLKKGAGDYLGRLKSGGVTLCVATASHEELFVPALRRNGVYEMFDHITTLSEVERGKGFPDIYLKCAEKAGREVSSCAVFEDLPEGIEGAKAGGFYTVGIYDKNTTGPALEKARSLCDKFINSFEELL